MFPHWRKYFNDPNNEHLRALINQREQAIKENGELQKRMTVSLTSDAILKAKEDLKNKIDRLVIEIEAEIKKIKQDGEAHRKWKIQTWVSVIALLIAGGGLLYNFYSGFKLKQFDERLKNLEIKSDSLKKNSNDSHGVTSTPTSPSMETNPSTNP